VRSRGARAVSGGRRERVGDRAQVPDLSLLSSPRALGAVRANHAASRQHVMSAPRLLAVDVGGTFTDVVGVGEDGFIDAIKVPTSRARPEGSVLTGAAELGAGASVVFNH